MTIPNGAASFDNIRSEFGQPQSNVSLSQYYAGGSVLGAPINNVPTSGAISMNQLRGLNLTVTNGQNLDVSNYVNASESIIFKTNGVVYSNSVNTAALGVPSGRTGATTLVLNHNVSGKGGNGGAGQPVTHSAGSNAAGTGSAGNGSAGGPAIILVSPTFIDNNAAVRAGGGGGGGGSAFGAPNTGNISNGITCTTTNLKGIITNTNGSTNFTIGTGGGGGGGANSQNANASDGSGGGAGGGGHTTNFANGNRNVTSLGTPCTANFNYFSGRTCRMVANSNAAGVGPGASSGFGTNTTGGAGGVDGGAGGGRSAQNGSTNFPTISENGNSVSNLSGVGGDASSGGGVGNAYQGWNSYSTTANGISSTQGTYTGGVT